MMRVSYARSQLAAGGLNRQDPPMFPRGPQLAHCASARALLTPPPNIAGRIAPPLLAQAGGSRRSSGAGSRRASVPTPTSAPEPQDEPQDEPQTSRAGRVLTATAPRNRGRIARRRHLSEQEKTNLVAAYLKLPTFRRGGKLVRKGWRQRSAAEAARR